MPTHHLPHLPCGRLVKHRFSLNSAVPPVQVLTLTCPHPTHPCRLAKRRFYVAEDGRIMRRHTHNRHNKSKRSKAALRRLKGDTPLAKGYARKLHKLGFKRKSWYHVKKG